MGKSVNESLNAKPGPLIAPCQISRSLPLLISLSLASLPLFWQLYISSLSLYPSLSLLLSFKLWGKQARGCLHMVRVLSRSLACALFQLRDNLISTGQTSFQLPTLTHIRNSSCRSNNLWLLSSLAWLSSKSMSFPARAAKLEPACRGYHKPSGLRGATELVTL